jgi:hypothetical protein
MKHDPSPGRNAPPSDRPVDRDWIGRVIQADADAEGLFYTLMRVVSVEVREEDYSWMQASALVAIAAELRAQRIARRPGAGQ